MKNLKHLVSGGKNEEEKGLTKGQAEPDLLGSGNPRLPG